MIWLWHEFLFGIGATNPSDEQYGFWSGFGSDISEIALLGAMFGVLRHSNCHAERCWRFGKPVDGTAYRACHKHHPAHLGDKRNVPLEVIRDAHREAHK
jgi:hypothetical protein